MKKLEELGASPAPWEIDDPWTGDIICHLKNGIEYQVATPYIHSDEETDANARLIAAAPEMYECLREAVEYHCQDRCPAHGCGCNKDCLFYKWRDAIAKASGEGAS